jgi:hypothetical protein
MSEQSQPAHDFDVYYVCRNCGRTWFDTARLGMGCEAGPFMVEEKPRVDPR